MASRISAAAVTALAVAAMLFIARAQAQSFYIGGEGGWTDLESQKDRAVSGPSAKANFDSGFNVGARAGYQWGPWRFEEEYSYQQNNLHSLSIAGIGVPGANGDRHAHAIMTNVLYDLNLGWPVTPHIGAGVGAVDVVDNVRSPGLGQIASDNAWEFGYQGIAGVEYNFNPNLALDVDYRYLATTDSTFNSPVLGKYHSGYSSHNVVASLIYRFGPPPPPPPPVVAPAAPPAPPPAVSRRVFLVFFDWDRAAITPEGMRIIDQAADAWKSGSAVQIQVTGYTDRSGSAGYNQRLSERRADAVATALAGRGVPRNEMAVSGRGENDNRVPTANGVREPQNRRVEIVF